MKSKDRIEEQVGKALGQFDKAERLPPNPFFYTRVQQRIHERSGKHPALFRVLKPALVTLLLAVNIWTFVSYFTGSRMNKTIDSRQEVIKMLSADLNLENNQDNILFP